MSQVSEELFDIRNIERFIQEEALTPEQAAAHLESLEDCADNAETSTVQMVRSVRARGSSYSEEPGAEEDDG